MKKILVSMMLLITQVAFAGWFSNPCKGIFFDDYEKTLYSHRANLAEYRRLTGKKFGKNEIEKSGVGSFTGALLCPLAAGFAIASGGAGIAGPLLFCGGSLSAGAVADGVVDSSRHPTISQFSEEKQKSIDEITLKITDSSARAAAVVAREIMLYHADYSSVVNTILESSEKISGEKLDRNLLNKALATMRASQTAEFCPNNQPMSFSELTAELLRRYHNMGGN